MPTGLAGPVMSRTLTAEHYRDEGQAASLAPQTPERLCAPFQGAQELLNLHHQEHLVSVSLNWTFNCHCITVPCTLLTQLQFCKCMYTQEQSPFKLTFDILFIRFYFAGFSLSYT